MIRLSRLASARIVLALGVSAAVLSACAYNEALGRSQFLIVDNAALSQQSTAAWREAIAKPGVITTGAQVQRIFAFGPLPGVAIMVAMTTHAGTCCLGFNVDGDAVEDLSVLMECFQQGLDEVLAIAR